MSAIFGLVGVVIGAFIPLLWQTYQERLRNKKDLTYIAVRLAAELDRYTSQCADTVADDGLCDGQRGPDGYRHPQTDEPEFDPLSIDGEWRSIPTELMYEILDLPYLSEITRKKVEQSSLYDNAPDYEQTFELRQKEYASLGLRAANLARRLRKEAGMPERKITGWNPVDFIQERLDELNQLDHNT